MRDFQAASTAAGTDPRRLETRGLGLSRGGRRVLDAIDLTLGAHGITVVMGPNGAGKSLLLRVLHGLIPPDAGTVIWGGQPMDALGRRDQAFVFQKPVLLRRSVEANLTFALGARGVRDRSIVAGLLDRVGLAGREPHPARLLSGGEQQRLALARALATGPQVLFLDEPTASLDPRSTAQIERVVRDAARTGLRVFFVTHDPAQARRIADDIVFIDGGRVAETGPADRVLATPRSLAAREYLAGRLHLDS